MLITEIAEKTSRHPRYRPYDRRLSQATDNVGISASENSAGWHPELPEDTIAAYYDRHHAEMRVETPMVRGILVKIPTSSPLLENVRKWYRSDKDTDIELLEKQI